MPSFTYDFPYASQEAAGLRRQRRRLLAASRRDGRPAHAGQGRQRGRCRDRQRDRHHRGRADHERHRRRRLLHPVGRHEAGRPQRLGPFAGADDARPVRGPGQDAEHRLGQRQHAGRGVAVDELHARYGKLPFADLFEPAIKYASDGFRVSYMVARQWARAVDRLRASRTGCATSCRTAARRSRASSGSSPIRRRRWPRSPRPRARPSIAASSPRRWTATPGRPAARCAATTSPSTSADWVDPIGLTYRGTTLHEIPPSGQGIAACMALGILENFDVAGHDRRRAGSGASAGSRR